MDYMISTPEGIERTAGSFNEAKQIAAILKKQGNDPIIDQYDEQEELTGTYWVYKANKLVKA